MVLRCPQVHCSIIPLPESDTMEDRARETRSPRATPHPAVHRQCAAQTDGDALKRPLFYSLLCIRVCVSRACGAILLCYTAAVSVTIDLVSVSSPKSIKHRGLLSWGEHHLETCTRLDASLNSFTHERRTRTYKRLAFKIKRRLGGPTV